MRRLAIELIVVTGAALLIAPCLAAQQRADSAGARRSAEQAQSRFERVRRVNLPPRNAGVRGQCDARIGRFCQYNEESDTIVAKESRAIRGAST